MPVSNKQHRIGSQRYTRNKSIVVFKFISKYNMNQQNGSKSARLPTIMTVIKLILILSTQHSCSKDNHEENSYKMVEQPTSLLKGGGGEGGGPPHVFGRFPKVCSLSLVDFRVVCSFIQ